MRNFNLKLLLFILYVFASADSFAKIGWLGSWPYPKGGKQVVDNDPFNYPAVTSNSPLNISPSLKLDNAASKNEIASVDASGYAETGYSDTGAYDESAVSQDQYYEQDYDDNYQDEAGYVDNGYDDQGLDASYQENVATNETGNIIPNEQSNMVDLNNIYQPN